MLFTLLPSVKLVSPLHPSKADAPTDVTLLGIETLVSPVQPENALLPILVVLAFIVTPFAQVQFAYIDAESVVSAIRL